MAKRFGLVLQIIDGYASVRDFLKDLGMWGPLTTAALAVATYVWAASENQPPSTRAVLAAAVFVIGLSLLLVMRIWAQVRPQALPEDLARSHITHLSFRIVDMARDELVIRNRTFEDCTIYGPAMLGAVEGGVKTFEHCGFDGTVESIAWADAPGHAIIGVIGLEGCVFRRCRFIKVGFVGGAPLRQMMNAALRAKP